MQPLQPCTGSGQTPSLHYRNIHIQMPTPSSPLTLNPYQSPMAVPRPRTVAVMATGSTTGQGLLVIMVILKTLSLIKSVTGLRTLTYMIKTWRLRWEVRWLEDLRDRKWATGR